MEKGYKNIAYFFVVISVIIFIGFYKSYFGLFPAFVAIKTIHHIHAFTLLSWLALLIIQPVLIRQKKYKWHRILGKVSYVLVPLIVIFMLLVYKNQYLKGEINGDPHTQNLAILFLPFTDTVPFTIFYILAIINRKNIQKHMRYMICTAIVVVGPGLGRIFTVLLHLDFITTTVAISVINLLLLAGFVFYDKTKGQRFKISPFSYAILIFLPPNFLLFFIAFSTWWQSLAEGIVKTFF